MHLEQMYTDEDRTITEITPLADCLHYVVERNKDAFDFPVHKHDAYELNFLCKCRGARRIVGDSIEELENLDMVFVGHGIEHGWEQHNCVSDSIHEITVQLAPSFFNEEYIRRNRMYSLSKLLSKSPYGIKFGIESILYTYSQLRDIVYESNYSMNPQRIVTFFITLADMEDYETLSSTTFTNIPQHSDSRRINKVQEYIENHYREKIFLPQLSELVSMSQSAFSRFFKLRTGLTISDFILEKRLGSATRMLVDTNMSVSEICYDCGFNNLSHFSRCFRQRKGCTPSEFREMYKKVRRN